MMTTANETSVYVQRQHALAESEAGRLAITMRPGTKWRTPSGEIVTVWKAWVPDLEGKSEKIAEQYDWYIGPDHNSQIGVQGDRDVQHVNVSEVASWEQVA